MTRTLALILTLVLGLGLAWVGAHTPPVKPAGAPATDFSAARAMADVNELGKAPHPIDSVRHDQLRDYLIGRLKALGLETRVQTGSAAVAEGRFGLRAILGGDVQNLIGVLPGRDRSAKVVAVTAHYDSVPNSPGASDDTAGVATALEVARAIKAQGVPARDVVFLITDGEEGDLLGARSFYASDPLAKRVGAVVNMDTRGGGGRTFMFETGRGNGAMIDLFRRNTPHPNSTSVAVFLYEHMPNGTDFTVPKDLGVQGLNFAFMGREFDYHAASSTPARLEQGSLQDMGDQVLGVTRALAFDPTLPKKAPDAVYADAFGHLVIAYSPAIGWVLLIVSLILAGVATAIALQRGETRGVEIARGAAGSLGLLLFVAALFYLARGATGLPAGFAAQRPLLGVFLVFEAGLAALGLGAVLLIVGGQLDGRRRRWAFGVALLVAIGCVAVGHADKLSLHIGGVAVIAGLIGLLAFGKPVRAWGVIAGFLILSGLFTLIAQALAPSLAIAFAWPFAISAVSACLAALIGGLDRPATLIVTSLLGILGLGWVLDNAHGVTLGIGTDLPSALTLYAWLSATCLIPLLAAQRQATAGGLIAAIVGVILIGDAALNHGPTPEHPRATDVLYVADLDHHAFLRVDPMDRMDAWSSAVLRADGGRIGRETIPTLSRDPLFEAAARPVAIESAPVTMTLADGRVSIRTGALRRIQLAIRSTVPLTDVRSGGMTLKDLGKPGEWTNLIWEASATRDVSAPILSFAATGHGTVEVRYASIVPGWPKDATPLPPRPANAMPWSLSDSTAEIGTLKQSW
jgi:hypothetical protein